MNLSPREVAVVEKGIARLVGDFRLASESERIAMFERAVESGIKSSADAATYKALVDSTLVAGRFQGATFTCGMFLIHVILIWIQY